MTILSSKSGSEIWTKTLGTEGEESGFSLTVPSDGNIYITGYTSGDLDGQTNSGGVIDIGLPFPNYFLIHSHQLLLPSVLIFLLYWEHY